jgi:tetratricopeptide (TPR) repeat protein
MVAGATPSAASGRSQSSGGWLFGPLPDLALGCGLAYAVIFAGFALAGPDLIASQPIALAPLIALVLSGPHYGGTLLRVYEQRSDRRSYALFSLWATLAVAVAFAFSVHDLAVGAWLFTVYLTWSPWHYTGQNYGLCVMFLRRRGIALPPLTKRLLYASFMSSYAITVLVLHGSSEASGYLPNPVSYDEPVVSLRSLHIPYAVTAPLLAFASLVYAGTSVAVVSLLGRGGAWRQLGPALMLMATQALWFSLPFSVTFWKFQTGIGPLDASVSSRYVLWIAVGHALQYLWVTTYYARASPRWSGYGSYFAKVFASGAAVWTVPAIVFAPDLLGDPEYAGGLALLIASAVNIHHFILDGAIWKLRNNRVAGVLIRSAAADAPQDDASRPWLRRGVWAVCGGAACVALAMVALEHFTFRPLLEADELGRARSVLDRMAWFGQDSSRNRALLGRALAREGRLEEAEAAYWRSGELRASAAAWRGIAGVRAAREDWAGVIAAQRASRARFPLDPVLASQAVRAHYTLGQRDEARAIMEELLATTPDSAQSHALMADFARSAGDLEWAARQYRVALSLEPDRRTTANNLAWILATASDPALRDPEESVRLAERALRGADPPDPNHLDTLAEAYASAGRIEDAIETSRRALRVATESGDSELAEGLRARLEGYRARRSDAPEAGHSQLGSGEPAA